MKKTRAHALHVAHLVIQLHGLLSSRDVFLAKGNPRSVNSERAKGTTECLAQDYFDTLPLEEGYPGITTVLIRVFLKIGDPKETHKMNVALGQHQWYPFGVGEFTTHFRTYFSGWIGMLTGTNRFGC